MKQMLLRKPGWPQHGRKGIGSVKGLGFSLTCMVLSANPEGPSTRYLGG